MIPHAAEDSGVGPQPGERVHRELDTALVGRLFHPGCERVQAGHDHVVRLSALAAGQPHRWTARWARSRAGCANLKQASVIYHRCACSTADSGRVDRRLGRLHRRPDPGHRRSHVSACARRRSLSHFGAAHVGASRAPRATRRRTGRAGWSPARAASSASRRSFELTCAGSLLLSMRP